jgi:hypothetical protein
MEAEKLTGPSALAERLVQCLIPPPARETVVGDLREIYRGPAQYAAEACRTVPMVIASCALRAVNGPLLLLQGGLIFFCLEGFADRLPGFDPLRIGAITAAALLAIILADTYRQAGRPTVHRSIFEAIAIAFFMLIFCPEAFGLKDAAVGTPDFTMQFQLITLLPLAIPLLGILRTLLILRGDRDLIAFTGGADTADGEAVAESYRTLVCRLRRDYRIEAAVLMLAAATMQGLLQLSPWLAGLYALVAAFLLVLSRVRVPQGEDAQSQRAEYRRQLIQHQQLRRFLLWLWAAPVLVAIYEQLLRGGFSANRAVLVTGGSATLILVCFLVGAINREAMGRAQEKIGLLERMRTR